MSANGSANGQGVGSKQWLTLRFTVNGENRAVQAPPMKRLLDVLREDLRLTGALEFFDERMGHRARRGRIRGRINFQNGRYIRPASRSRAAAG